MSDQTDPNASQPDAVIAAQPATGDASGASEPNTGSVAPQPETAATDAPSGSGKETLSIAVDATALQAALDEFKAALAADKADRDAALEALRTELRADIDSLGAHVDERLNKVDADSLGALADKAQEALKGHPELAARLKSLEERLKHFL